MPLPQEVVPGRMRNTQPANAQVTDDLYSSRRMGNLDDRITTAEASISRLQLFPQATGNGTVSVVGLSMPSIFTVTGAPITSSGQINVTLAAQSQNKVLAGPTSGADATPTFRALVPQDMPLGPGNGTASGKFYVAMTDADYGDGSDGDVTITGGTTTLAADMFYDNLTITGTGVLATASYKIFVKGTLLIQASGIIQNNGNNGSTTGGGSAGAAGGTFLPAATLGSSSGGTNGATGTSTGVPSTPALAAGTSGDGGSGGASGAGGAGSVGAGGLGRGSGAITRVKARIRNANRLFGLVLIQGGRGGAGGGGGSGDGTIAGGGGGGGGAGGGPIWICGNILNNSGTVRSNGGNAGNGSQPFAGTILGCGGGAGGGGGGGGQIEAWFNTVTALGTFQSNGGNAGTGANGRGTGTAGAPGGAGFGGTVKVYEVGQGNYQVNVDGT